MAEAGNDNSTEWILLGDCIEREFARVHSAHLADRLVRRNLNEGRLKCRYLDADGKTHSGSDLPKGFWLEAEISREEHTATRPAKPIPPDSIVADFVARHRSVEDAMWVFRTGRPPQPQPLEPRMCPAIEIYRVEVLVWRVGPTPREEPTEAASEPAVPPELAETAPVAEQSAQPQKARRSGRPSSAELVLVEAERRLKAGAVPRTRKVFLQQLSDWLCDTHRETRQMASKTVGDHLRNNEAVRTLLPKAWLRRR
jgi:hypothetical protein